MQTGSATGTPRRVVVWMARFGEAIYERRDVVGLTGPEVASLSSTYALEDPATYAKFSQQTLSRWESDRTGALIAASSPARIRSLARALQWSVQEFEQRVGVPAGGSPPLSGSQGLEIASPGRNVNVYAAGTGPAWGDTQVLEQLYIASLPADGSYIGLKATGESMAPYLGRGDIAIVLCDDGAARPGDHCAIWLADDGCVIKQFLAERSDGTLVLQSLNPATPSEKVFDAPLGSRVIGPVVGRYLKEPR